MSKEQVSIRLRPETISKLRQLQRLYKEVKGLEISLSELIDRLLQSELKKQLYELQELADRKKAEALDNSNVLFRDSNRMYILW